MSGNERFLTVSKFFVLFFLAFQISASAASIENEEPFSPDQKAGTSKAPVTTLVAATRREVPIEKVTRAVTVITREEIEKSGKIYLMDLLRGVPGVTVNQLGSVGRQAEISIRGQGQESTLVMIDGVQVNNSNQGIPSIQHITTADIERIEIIRGPQSVLYGADAAGGVINIVTRADRQKGIHGDAEFQYGTYETFYEEAGLHGGTEKLSFSGAGSRLDTDGLSENDDYENTTARFRGKAELTENSELDVAFHHLNSIVGIDDGVVSNVFRTDPNRNTRANQQVLNTRFTHNTADWWDQYVQYSLFHDNSFTHDPRNPDVFTGADPETFLHINSNRHTFEYQSDFYIEDYDVLTMGYEFENSNFLSTNNHSVARNHGWFVQNELTLWKVWTLAAGTRFDQQELYGFQASPLVSTGLWIAKTQTKLKGSFGKGFRAPTFNQLFFPNFGDPNLKPEKSWTWDGGFEQFYWGQRGSFSVMYFNTRTRDLLVNTTTAAVNVGSARSQGLEFENRIRLIDGLEFVTTYTYMHAVDLDTDKRLHRIPRHQGKFGLAYDYKRFHFTGDLVWVGRREDVGRTLSVRLDEYMRLDMAAFYDVTKYLQVYGRVENATDDKYYEANGFDMPHSGFYSGLKGKF